MKIMSQNKKNTSLSVITLVLIAVLFTALLGACTNNRTATFQESVSSTSARSEQNAPKESKEEKPDASSKPESVANSEPQKAMPDVVDEPTLSSSAVEITPELMKQLRNRIQTTHKAGVDAPDAIGEFIKANHDFLYNQSGRILISRGDKTIDDGGEYPRLLLWDGATPETDLLNRERLAAFVEHYKAGIPDRIGVISAGAPVAVDITVFTYDGNGTTYTAESYGVDLENPRVAQIDTLVETDSEWLMINLTDWKIRYPKYGYEPVPLSGSGQEVVQTKAQQAVETYIKERYSETTYTVSPLEQQAIGNELVYVFEALDTSDNFSTLVLAVSTNLNSIYEREQMNGQWVLHARPKSAVPVS